MNLPEELKNFLDKKQTAAEFAKKAIAHLESPEGRRQIARIESEQLLENKKARATLYGLIEEAQAKGRKISHCAVQLRKGGDSIRVEYEADGVVYTAFFPFFFAEEWVIDGFKTLMNKNVIG
jgi:hypothetical protein